jgi:hypothetical protein
MQQLATIIRGRLDALVDQYDARLRTMPGNVDGSTLAGRTN